MKTVTLYPASGRVRVCDNTMLYRFQVHAQPSRRERSYGLLFDVAVPSECSSSLFFLNALGAPTTVPEVLLDLRTQGNFPITYCAAEAAAQQIISSDAAHQTKLAAGQGCQTDNGSPYFYDGGVKKALENHEYYTTGSPATVQRSSIQTLAQNVYYNHLINNVVVLPVTCTNDNTPGERLA